MSAKSPSARLLLVAGVSVALFSSCTALTIRSTAECKCNEEATAKCTTTGNEAAVGHSSPQGGTK